VDELLQFISTVVCVNCVYKSESEFSPHFVYERKKYNFYNFFLNQVCSFVSAFVKKEVYVLKKVLEFFAASI
jgi:hypothetical protein